MLAKNPFRTIHKHPFALSVQKIIRNKQKNVEVMEIGAELLHEELHHPLGTCDLVFGLHVDVSEKSFRDHS